MIQATRTTKRKGQQDEGRILLGRRVRRRRLFLKMTQASLAKSLGISFQQIQKYESGSNRIPDSRLREMAHFLDVPIDYFSTNSLYESAQQGDVHEIFLESPQGIALSCAIARISDTNIRGRLIMAVEAFCDSHIKPEEMEAASLSTWLQSLARERNSTQYSEDAATSIHVMKIELAKLIGKTLIARKLTQKFATQILHTDQARISALARGDVRATSLEKLLRYLILLGWDVSTDIAKRPIDQRGKLEIRTRTS